MGEKHRVVILGGGFGGLAAAQKLKRAPVEVTLIDRRNFHLFQPLLYQVATGSLSPGEIAAPLRGVLSKQKNTRVLLGEAVDVDPRAKRETLRHDFRKIDPQKARIILMEGAPRVLGPFPEDLSAKAEKLVTRLGVEVIKGVMVTNIDAAGVTFKHGDSSEKLAAKTVLWAGGVTATPFGRKLAERTKSESDRNGRIKVNRDLTIPNFPDIFIIGDLAHAVDEKGTPLPGVAQVAMQGGAYAAKNIRARLDGKKELPAFHYFNKGEMAVIGRAAAVANIFGVHVSGLLAWLMWLFIHLIYIVEFQIRILVFIQWGFEYLTFSRGARLITGDDATGFVAKTKAGGSTGEGR